MPDVAWVGDITYIGTGEGWLYLVADALHMAVATRGGQVEGTIFHGDRGSQYMSIDYRNLVTGYAMWS